MKKNTYEAIYAALSTVEFENKDAIMDELNAEIHRADEVKAKKAQEYEAINAVILENLDSTPVTCSELFDAIEHLLPEGTSKGKVQYALTHNFTADVVKRIPGKPNTYCRA